MEAAEKQANRYIEKLLKIEVLINDMFQFDRKNNINSQYIIAVSKKPMFTVKNISEMLGVTYNTANKNITKLLESGKIYPDDRKRNKIFRFYDLLDLLRS